MLQYFKNMEIIFENKFSRGQDEVISFVQYAMIYTYLSQNIKTIDRE